MERIADILARKYPQFNTVVPHCLVSDALYQMRCENVDYLIVLDEDKFQGIITDHDIASRILFENRPLNRIQVKEFMSKSLPVTTPETSIGQCMQLMERYNVRHLAIFDRFNFRGVISSYDLMHEALTKQTEEEKY
ncbi:CBS domain-containing protein, partial [Mycobacteroides abscessus]|uniref:CBS domain-containing protein n=1 Tax=Mycobacteroides abscessus TaxID=36809 RepID=UPI0018964CA6